MLPVAVAGCSLLLEDGYSSGARADAAAPAEDAAPGPIDGSDASLSSDAPLTIGGYAAVVLADAPVAYYPLDETSGPTVHDQSGNHNDGVVEEPGTATFGVPGAGGATASALRLPTRFGIDVGQRFGFPGRVPCSFEAWVKPRANVSGYRRIFEKATFGPAPIDGTYFYFNDDVDRIALERWRGGNNRQSAAATHTLANDRFTHVVGVVTMEQVFLYIDGERVADGVNFEGITDPNVPGRWMPDFFGDVDELAIYDKVLGSDRVRAHFEAANRP